MTFIFITKPHNRLCIQFTKDEIKNCDRLLNKIDLPSPEVN
jgi:hypothetical protein